MDTKTFIPTAEKVTVENYPYGYTLKTTLFDTIDFDPKKGYRHVTQTINPKNGRLNNPKKGTYSNFMLRYKDDKGHIKTMHISFNTYFEKMNEPAQKVSEIWDILTTEEREYMIREFKMHLHSSFIASVTYSGLDAEIGKEELRKIANYLNSFANMEERKVKGEIKKVITSYNVEQNIFANLPQIDAEKLKANTPEDYQPFKITQSVRIL